MATKKKAAPKKAAAKKSATVASKKSAPKKSVPAVKPAVATDATTTSGLPPAEQVQQQPNEDQQQETAKTLASKDAFEKLNSGKTIRRAGWPEGEHLVSENGNVFRQIGENRRDLYSSTAEDAAAEDWSVK